MFTSDTSDPRPPPKPHAAASGFACRLASRLTAGLAALACSACITAPAPKPVPPPPPPAPAPAPEPTPVVQTIYVPTQEPADQAARHLLAQHERLLRFGPPELAQEVARLADPTGPGYGSPQNMVDLALTLAQTRSASDLARAQGLLDQVVRNAAAPEWQPLARLLAARYAEQRRAEEQTERTAQQLRETQRDSQRRIEQLNDKLDALKAIERSLNSRGTPASQPAASRRSS